MDEDRAYFNIHWALMMILLLLVLPVVISMDLPIDRLNPYIHMGIGKINEYLNSSKVLETLTFDEFGYADNHLDPLRLQTGVAHFQEHERVCERVFGSKVCAKATADGDVVTLYHLADTRVSQIKLLKAYTDEETMALIVKGEFIFELDVIKGDIRLAMKVGFVGAPIHEHYRGDFKLTSPRPKATFEISLGIVKIENGYYYQVETLDVDHLYVEYDKEHVHINDLGIFKPMGDLIIQATKTQVRQMLGDKGSVAKELDNKINKALGGVEAKINHMLLSYPIKLE